MNKNQHRRKPYTRIRLIFGRCRACNENRHLRGCEGSLEPIVRAMAIEQKKQQLNELHLNLLGKMFIGAIGAWLVGKLTNIKVRGTQEQVNAVANAMMASRRFQDELSKSGASVESVVEKWGLKRASAAEFERILGIQWPL